MLRQNCTVQISLHYLIVLQLMSKINVRKVVEFVATWCNGEAIIAKSRNKFYFSQQLLQLVSQHSFKLGYTLQSFVQLVSIGVTSCVTEQVLDSDIGHPWLCNTHYVFLTDRLNVSAHTKPVYLLLTIGRQISEKIAPCLWCTITLLCDWSITSQLQHNYY